MPVEMPWWQAIMFGPRLGGHHGSPSVGGKAEAAPGSPTLGTWTEVIEGSQAAPPTRDQNDPERQNGHSKSRFYRARRRLQAASAGSEGWEGKRLKGPRGLERVFGSGAELI